MWQRAHGLALVVYRSTNGFPHAERFALTNQIRRAPVSLVADIAAGCGRFTAAERARFFDMAGGSICELEALILIARDLDYLDSRTGATLLAEIAEVRRMLVALTARIRRRA